MTSVQGKPKALLLRQPVLRQYNLKAQLVANCAFRLLEFLSSGYRRCFFHLEETETEQNQKNGSAGSGGELRPSFKDYPLSLSYSKSEPAGPVQPLAYFCEK